MQQNITIVCIKDYEEPSSTLYFLFLWHISTVHSLGFIRAGELETRQGPLKLLAYFRGWVCVLVFGDLIFTIFE